MTFEAISEEVFARVNGIDLASDIWKELIEIHEGSTKTSPAHTHTCKQWQTLRNSIQYIKTAN